MTLSGKPGSRGKVRTASRSRARGGLTKPATHPGEGGRQAGLRATVSGRLRERVDESMEIEGRVPAGKPDLEAASLRVYPVRPDEIRDEADCWDVWWTPGLGLMVVLLSEGMGLLKPRVATGE